MNTTFAIIAVCLVIVAYVPYLVKIRKKLVKPHPVTWLVWTVTASMVFLLQMSNGSGTGAFATAAMAFFAFLVFLMTARRGAASINPVDILCVVMAMLGVGMWFIVQDPVSAIMIMLGVELIGFIPTLFKGYRRPYEDSVMLWTLTVARHTAALLAIQQYNLITLVNPITWITIGTVFTIILIARRIVTATPKKRPQVQQPHV